VPYYVKDTGAGFAIMFSDGAREVPRTKLQNIALFLQKLIDCLNKEPTDEAYLANLIFPNTHELAI
jgi:hypothetical protein